MSAEKPRVRPETVLERILPLGDASELARRIVMAQVLGPPPARRGRRV